MDIFPLPKPAQLAAPQSLTLLIDQDVAHVYTGQSGHSEQPNFWHLAALVCEAVLEVVCVSSLGFIAAKKGLFPAKVQKDMANLNIYFFTPCLIFSKLAAQLTGDKLTELWIIPIILFTQTVVSWLAAETCTRLIKLNKLPQRNFVKAMAVFGNSNSLPLSLVLSLSHTISGLHWDKIPGDNDKEVGARGILYLLVFSQLGQAVRWSWGMNTLLRPLSLYTPAERGEIPRDEEDPGVYKDDDDDSLGPDSSTQGSSHASSSRQRDTSGTQTPVEPSRNDEISTASGHENETYSNTTTHQRGSLRAPPLETPTRPKSPIAPVLEAADNIHNGFKKWSQETFTQAKNAVFQTCRVGIGSVSKAGHRIFNSLPHPIQKSLRALWFWTYLTVTRFMGCLNVPLAAIIISVVVGSVPSLRAFFYTPGTFINNTVTSAINQLAGVAVPLILFVLGGNLCKGTLPSEDLDAEYRREQRLMLWCAIVCRMVIPLLVMTPFLAALARFTPISILDDPIFIIVCFLLTGAPSALQLAQICQVNDVFVPVISKLLVQSYVVWIFPSTLVLVMLALEVVRWAQ